MTALPVPLWKHHGTYYFGTVANEWDWTAPHNDNLWQDGIKTLLDPCPPGWRVPKSGMGVANPWNAFGTNAYAAPFFYYINGVRQTAPGVPAFVFSPNNGRRYDRGNGSATAWYPGTGNRYSGGGELAYVGNLGFSWSSSVSGTNAGYLDFYSTSLSPSGAHFRAYGFPVRCVRE